MSKTKISSGKENRKRTGAIPFTLAFSAAALAVSGAAYGAKPVPSLNATVCTSISGVWMSAGVGKIFPAGALRMSSVTALVRSAGGVLMKKSQ